MKKNKIVDTIIENTLVEVYERLVKNSKPLDPKYSQFIQEHFWDLIGEDNGK